MATTDDLEAKKAAERVAWAKANPDHPHSAQIRLDALEAQVAKLSTRGSVTLTPAK